MQQMLLQCIADEHNIEVQCDSLVWFCIHWIPNQLSSANHCTEELDCTQCYTMDLGTLQFCNAFICTELRGGHSSALPLAFMRIHEDEARERIDSLYCNCWILVSLSDYWISE